MYLLSSNMANSMSKESLRFGWSRARARAFRRSYVTSLKTNTLSRMCVALSLHNFSSRPSRLLDRCWVVPRLSVSRPVAECHALESLPGSCTPRPHQPVCLVHACATRALSSHVSPARESAGRLAWFTSALEAPDGSICLVCGVSMARSLPPLLQLLV